MSELKPCPHCGGEVSLFGIEATGYFMACNTPECYGFNCAKFGHDETVKAWNTRRPTPEPQGEAVANCGCETCRPITLQDMRMIVCAICGNKRCPHATDHRNACTNSNEPGQKGSSWENYTRPQPGEAHCATDHGIEQSAKATFVPCDCGCGRSCCAHCGVDVGFISQPGEGGGEVTGDMVESACVSMYEDWPRFHQNERENFRKTMRAALTAALSKGAPRG